MAYIATSSKHTIVERGIYRSIGINPDEEQSWKHYAKAILGFSLAGYVLLYALLRLNPMLPLSYGRRAFSPDEAFNTAVSFVTNTNWQWYSGENLGHLPQMLGLTVQNFLSAAVGISVAFALVRGFARHNTDRLGNFFVDLTRVSLRLLLPMAFFVAILLVTGGVIQTFAGSLNVGTIAGGHQYIPLGPVASQEAIKELGTNGGGFFGANGAHPFENPSPLTSILHIWALSVIPFSLPYTFGKMIGQRRQGVAILLVMVILQLSTFFVTVAAETAHSGKALLAAGGAMEGKETRYGIWGSVMYAAFATGTSSGAVNSMHDSYTGLGGGMLMLNMMMGEVSPGGVGTGLYGILIVAVLAVFIAGLMVGRTPEYLGKRIGKAEITAAALYILAVPFALLIGAASTLLLPRSYATLQDPGAHGLSELLYGYASAANNNGSAFAGFGGAFSPHIVAQALVMLIGRFIPMIFALALAGALAKQQQAKVTAGTLPTHGPLFVVLCIGIIIIVAGLTFFPALTLGPIAEALL